MNSANKRLQINSLNFGENHQNMIYRSEFMKGPTNKYTDLEIAILILLSLSADNKLVNAMVKNYSSGLLRETPCTFPFVLIVF